MQDVDVDDDEQRLCYQIFGFGARPRCMESVVEGCQRHPLRSPRHQPLLVPVMAERCTQVRPQGDQFVTCTCNWHRKNSWTPYNGDSDALRRSSKLISRLGVTTTVLGTSLATNIVRKRIISSLTFNGVLCWFFGFVDGISREIILQRLYYTKLRVHSDIL